MVIKRNKISNCSFHFQSYHITYHQFILEMYSLLQRGLQSSGSLLVLFCDFVDLRAGILNVILNFWLFWFTDHGHQLLSSDVEILQVYLRSLDLLFESLDSKNNNLRFPH